jgi:hypothetical protein
MKKCKACRITKELSEFGNRKRNKDGLNGQCKACESEYGKMYRKGYRAKDDETRDIDSTHIDMKGIRKFEWCNTFRILSKMGYNPELDLHTQFIERHPYLTLKPRPARNIRHFTWEDCKQETPTQESQGFEYEEEED